MLSAVLMKRVQYSLFSALLFYIVANPITYSVTDSLLGSFLPKISENGCPTGFGLLLHTVVFFYAVLGLMYL